jgi:serine/threonine protein kinase
MNGPPLTICGTGISLYPLPSQIFINNYADDWMAPEVILGMEYDERVSIPFKPFLCFIYVFYYFYLFIYFYFFIFYLFIYLITFFSQSDVFSFGVVLLECILGTDAVKDKLQRVANNFFELNTGMREGEGER